jgi:hypothetical protein
MRFARRHRRCAGRAAAVMLLAGLLSMQARAWSYREHWSISYQAYKAACINLADKFEAGSDTAAKLAGLCLPEVQGCFAHWVAIAGDHADKPSVYLDEAQRDKYLLNARRDIDCSDLFASRWQEGKEGDLAKVDRLFRWHLGVAWKFATLVADNGAHFQPRAGTEWSRLLRDLVFDEALEFEARAGYLAHAAFALHFLEDSFPSGHMGVQRELRWQDYDNGYHDDSNYTGRFVSNYADAYQAGAAIWYTFGDSYLDDIVPVISLRSLNGLDTAALVDTIGKINSAAYENDVLEPLSDEVAEHLRNEAVAAASEGEVMLNAADVALTALVLSFPKKSDSTVSRLPIRLCVFTNHCASRVVLLVRGGALPAQMQGCQPIEVPPPAIAWICAGQSRGQVVTAAEHAVSAVLLKLLGSDDVAVHKELDLADAGVPRSYLPLYVHQNGIGDSVNGSESSLLRYEAWRPQEEYCDQPTSGWGYAVTSQPETGPWDERIAFSTTLHKHYSSRRKTRKVGGCSNTQRSFFSYRVKLDLADSNGELLNGMEGALLMNFGRPRIGLRAIGFSPTIIAGAERWWEGRNRRNYFYGAGLSLDVHAGRRGFYLEFDQTYHKNERLGTEKMIRLMFSVRVTSVNMVRKYIARDDKNVGEPTKTR